MARSPIPDLIERFDQMSPEERACFLDLVDPQVEPEKQKRTRKKRATSAAPAKKRGLPQAATSEEDEVKCGICGNKKAFDDHQPEAKNYHEFDSGSSAASKIPPGLCAFKYQDGSDCLAPVSNAIHDQTFGYAGYHPFEAPKSVVRAPRKLKQKKEEPGSIPSTSTETETAIAAGAGD